jgi:sulfur carrier protein
MATITLNGKNMELANSMTLHQVVDQFCIGNKHVIVELNGTIIKTNLWKATAIKEGDQLELISIVGGG